MTRRRKCGCVVTTTSDARVRNGWGLSGEVVSECTSCRAHRLSSVPAGKTYTLKVEWPPDSRGSESHGVLVHNELVVANVKVERRIGSTVAFRFDRPITLDVHDTLRLEDA